MRSMRYGPIVLDAKMALTHTKLISILNDL